MDNDEVFRRLRELKPKFKDMNIKRLAVYGSRARGDNRPDSDVDLLVEFIETPNFFEFFDIKEDLEKKIGINVDFTTFNAAQRKKHMQHIIGEAKDV